MAGQESFSTGLDRATHMSHTPTTSSMLAALNDPFPSGGSLDPTSTSFNPASYSYMDTTPSHGDGSSQGSMNFSEFVPGSDNAFDVAGFSQDLGMNAGTTPASQHNERDVVEEAVKEEGV